MSIIVKLFGGLGNQMFQYALGRRLAIATDDRLLLDLDYFDQPAGEHTSRAFGLDAFRLPYDRATAQQVRSSHHGGSSFRAAIASIHSRLAPIRVLREKSFTFDPEVLSPHGPAYLDGYWQSERYFMDVAGSIRQDFAFRDPPTARNAGIAHRITQVHAISLHVRRGDYVAHAAASRYFEVCSSTYYKAAMEYVLARVSDAEFFVFSDDPEWARANLRSSAPLHFVEGDQGDGAHEDMRLMSLCKHHIIANSSFSWWGAWLDPSVDKIVVAPKKWFKDPTIDTHDLIPPSWPRL